MYERETKEEIVRLELEKDMEFLGISCVEDKLQEDVKTTINDIRDAGI